LKQSFIGGLHHCTNPIIYKKGVFIQSSIASKMYSTIPALYQSSIPSKQQTIIPALQQTTDFIDNFPPSTKNLLTLYQRHRAGATKV
jgi:hypothetical protein